MSDEINSLPENKNPTGIVLVQSLREYLIAYANMNLEDAQRIASGFDNHINWVDWIEVKNGTKIFTATWTIESSNSLAQG
jgi:hypothetical protein